MTDHQIVPNSDQPKIQMIIGHFLKTKNETTAQNVKTEMIVPNVQSVQAVQSAKTEMSATTEMRDLKDLNVIIVKIDTVRSLSPTARKDAMMHPPVINMARESITSVMSVTVKTTETTEIKKHAISQIPTHISDLIQIKARRKALGKTLVKIAVKIAVKALAKIQAKPNPVIIARIRINLPNVRKLAS